MLKSAWAERERTLAMKECKAALEPPKFSFIERDGGLIYAEKGQIKTYANKKQAAAKVKILRDAGHDVYRGYRWPYLIIKR